jgi:hypothetical protein
MRSRLTTAAAMAGIALTVLPAVATASTASWLGLVANNQYPTNAVGTFDPIAGVAGSPIPVSGDNVWVGPSPDGTRAYALVVYPPGNAGLQVIDLASRSVIAGASANGDPHNASWGAISPDGRLAYLTGNNGVMPVDLTTTPVKFGTQIPVPIGSMVAFTPDGKTAYVSSDVSSGAGVVPVDVATGQP